MVRPFRFVTTGSRIGEREELLARARRVESLGYDVFGMADHFMLPFAPLLALQAVADATTSLRLTQIVLAQDFRNPAVLAKELATLDVLSGGRLEIGIGAGWMQSEHEQAGIPFDKPSVRIERLEETVTVLKGLFGDDPVTFEGKHVTVRGLRGTPTPIQRPHPPFMIGGGGPKLLSVAARCADIIQVLPRAVTGIGSHVPASLTRASFEEKVAWIRDAAGDRFDDIELGALLMEVTITDDPGPAEDAFLATLGPSDGDGPSREEVLASPVVLIGPVEQVCEKLREAREAFGFNYFASPVGTTPELLAPIVERLAGV